MEIMFISLLVGAAIFLLILSVFRGALGELFSPSERYARMTQEKISKGRPEEIQKLIDEGKRDKGGKAMVSPSTVEAFTGMANKFQTLKKVFFSEGTLRTIDNMLIWAGRPNNLDAVQFVVMWVLLGVMGFAFALVVFILLGSNRLVSFFGVLVFFALVVTPWAYLQRLMKERQNKILAALSDKLDLMRVCIEAGITIDGSIPIISQGDSPLDKELQVLANDLSLAHTNEEKKQAYWNFASRCGVPEVEQTVQFLLHAQEVGQPPSETLLSLAEMARFNRRNYVDRMIEVLPNKITFPLVCCFMPAFFMVFVGPMFLKLLANL